jgi:hypothetical protein
MVTFYRIFLVLLVFIPCTLGVVQAGDPKSERRENSKAVKLLEPPDKAKGVPGIIRDLQEQIDKLKQQNKRYRSVVEVWAEGFQKELELVQQCAYNKVCNNPYEEKIVFVTSKRYDGNLEGLAGADAKCQELADDEGLPGQYKAWLSDNMFSPINRFTMGRKNYRLVDGTIVASNFQQLLTLDLQNPINRTEKGKKLLTAPPNNVPRVWSDTNLNIYGLEYPASGGWFTHCNQWTSNLPVYQVPGEVYYAFLGNPYRTSKSWSLEVNPDGYPFEFVFDQCANENMLYCFQQ